MNRLEVLDFAAMSDSKFVAVYPHFTGPT